VSRLQSNLPGFDESFQTMKEIKISGIHIYGNGTPEQFRGYPTASRSGNKTDRYCLLSHIIDRIE
jgi:hypothetical protein